MARQLPDGAAVGVCQNINIRNLTLFLLKEMKIRSLVFVICGLNSVSLLGGSSGPELVSSVEICLATPKLKEKTVESGLDLSSRPPMWLSEYSVYCRNVGHKPVVIPTIGFFRTTEGTPFSISESVSWKVETAPDGSALIRPNADYGFVTLLPGETAVIRWTGVEFSLKHFKNVEIDYNVPSEFSRRFACWSGNIKASSVKVTVDGKELYTNRVDK